jgi:hypothetical protein
MDAAAAAEDIATPDAISILDLNGRMLSWKPAGSGFRALAR